MIEGEGGSGPSEGGLAFTELSSSDPAETQRFLEKAFGWKFHSIAMPMGEYRSYETPDGRGGIRPARPAEAPSSLAYIRVHDLTAAQRRVEGAGAKVVLPHVEVPGMGCFFWFQVPGGPLLACWQDLPADPKHTKEQHR